MKYTVILIRDFPEFLIGWQGMYILGHFSYKEYAEAALKSEIKLRGGKYGGILIEDILGTHKEIMAISNFGDELKQD